MSNSSVKTQIESLLQEAEQCRSDPNKYDKIFKEIEKKLPFEEKIKASVKNSIDAKEIKADYLIRRVSILYDGLEDYENALKCYKELNDLSPHHPKVLKGLGDCSRKLGKHDEAIKYYENALDILLREDDDSCLQGSIFNNKALSFIEKNQLGLATHALKEAIGKEQTNPLYRVTLGRLYHQQKKMKEALENFEIAYDLLKTHSDKIDKTNRAYFKETLPHVMDMISLRNSIKAEQPQKEESKEQEGHDILNEIDEFTDRLLRLNPVRKTTYTIIMEQEHSMTQDVVLKQILEKQGQQFKEITQRVTKVENRMQDFERQLSEKLDFWRKKIENAIEKEIENPKFKEELLKEEIDATKIRQTLLEYYDGFSLTFDCVCSTAVTILEGDVKLNNSSIIGKAISFLVSFREVFDAWVPNAVKTIDEFWGSAKMKEKATQMTKLGNGNELGQMIGEIAFNIVMDQHYQKYICTIKDDDLKAHSKNWREKVVNFFKETVSQINIKLCGDPYKTLAAKLGNKDANILIGEWLKKDEKWLEENGKNKEKISNEFTSKIIKQAKIK